MANDITCGFYSMYFTTFKFSPIKPVHINTLKSNIKHRTFYLQCSIVVFKLHPLTVSMVTKCTYYYWHLCTYVSLQPKYAVYI